MSGVNTTRVNRCNFDLFVFKDMLMNPSSMCWVVLYGFVKLEN